MSGPIDPAAPAGPYVFVSYASADRERVLPIVGALRGAGIGVWLDQQGIAGGENYAAEIAEAIKGAAALVLLASPASLASRNVRQEIALAWRFERPYVPVRLDPVAIPDDLAYWLEAAQWVDVLRRPEGEWLPAVLAALAPLGVTPTAPPESIAATVTPIPLPPPGPPPVGRERELTALREHLAAALAGRGGLVLIGGEAGVGKTTLAEAILHEAAAQGALVLVGRCYDLSETPPYGPWRELFARAPRDAGLPPMPAAVLPPEHGGVALAGQEAILSRVQAYLVALAARQPVALLLDDQHWADAASLDLLRAVARNLTDVPIFCLATYRSDELTRRHPFYQLLPLLDREARATRLDLRRLEPAGVRGMVAARYALPEGDEARLVAWLVGRAEGNAFFTVQLLRALEDEGALVATATGWALGDLETLGLPAPLRQVLDARLSRLGEDQQRQLAIAAVLGQEVPLALWATVAETDEDGLLDTIERAVDARLLVESPDGAAVGFAHALIREVLYEGMLAARRRRAHRHAAEVLAARLDADPDAVAHHLQRAGDERAAEWLERAAERAQHAYAWGMAATRLEAALAILERRGGDPGARGWLVLRLVLLRRYADRPRTIALLAAAGDLAADAADPLLGAYVRFTTGLVRCYRLDFRAGVADMEAAVAALDALWPPDAATRARLRGWGLADDPDHQRGTLALWYAYTGRLADALALAEPVAARGAAARPAWLDGAFAPDALRGLGLTYAALGRPAEALAALEGNVAAYHAAGDHGQVATTQRNLLRQVYLPYRADDLAGRRRIIAEVGAAESRAAGNIAPLHARLSTASLQLVEGRWAEGRATVEAAAGLRLDQAGGTYKALVGAPLARWQGDRAAAWAVLREVFPAGPAIEPGAVFFVEHAVPLLPLAAALALDDGDAESARAWLASHDRLLAWSGAVLGRAEGELGWAAHHRAAGDQTLARRHAEAALAHATEPRQPLALLAAHRFLGELDTEAERYSDAAAHLDAALALAEVCAAPYERALTLLALAELRATEGQGEAARATLAEARGILEPLGARPALARANALAASLTGA